MKISGVYKIESRIKPKRGYIGSAINIHDRWIFHLWNLRKNIHNNKKLQRHYNKYGKNDLIFSILISCAKEDLINTEQFFIDSYNPYFNICKIANSQLGIKRSEETKEKIRLVHIGKKHSDETRINMSKNHADISGKNNPMYGIHISGKNHWNYGKHFSKESRRKMSESHKGDKNYNYGKHFSDEHKQKISQSEKKTKSLKLKIA